MKRKWIIILVTLGITLASPAMWAQKGQDCDLAGAWVAVSPPAGPYNTPLWGTLDITPTDPTGKRLVGRIGAVNDIINPAVPGSGASVATYLRSRKGTYQFTWILSFAVNNWPQRGTVTSINIYSGTVECTGPDSLAFTGMWSIYDPSQDQNGDGLPDPGQVPFLRVPFVWTAVRLPLLAP